MRRIAQVVLCLALAASCQERTAANGKTHQGDLSPHGGTPTVRKAYTPTEDNPITSNDESNDQPVGYFGTATLTVTNVGSGHSYSIDGEIENGALRRLYFPKGGSVDFYSCELEQDTSTTCSDENGRMWEIDGSEYAAGDSVTENENES